MSQPSHEGCATKINRELIERIVYLHDVEEKGFRKIANELDMSKSSVHRIYKEQAATFKEEVEKKLDGNEEYRTLKDKRLRFQKEVKKLHAIEEERKKIKELCLQKARTGEGLQDIFNSPEKMLEFTNATVGDYRSLFLSNPKVLESFIFYCQAHNLSLPETLFEVAGSLEEYEADPIDLDNHIGLQLEDFLSRRLEEERRKALQKKFEESLLNAKCPNCGEPFAEPFYFEDRYLGHTMVIVDGSLRCNNCDAFCELHCPSCGDELDYKKESGFHCSSCDVTLTIPHPEVEVQLPPVRITGVKVGDSIIEFADD